MAAAAMRVLQVCPYDISRAGGVQRHIVDLSNALSRAGHEVGVVAPAGDGAPALDAQVELYRLGRFREWRMHGTRFEVTRASARELQRFTARASAAPFDVAHFHTPWTPLMPWQVYRRAGAFAKRTVATFHDTPPPGASGAVMRAVFGVLSRRLSRGLDAMIAVSSAPAGHLRPVGRCPLVCLPPCIDLSPYVSVSRRREIDPGPTVLFVGRLEPRKGVLLLIEAFARVREAHPGVRLVVCGDGEQRRAAAELAEKRGLHHAVTFTGALPDAERLALYAHADVFCAPSPYGESYGLVIAEAMAAGLPVVAAANAGYRTVLTGAGAAGLAKPGDVAHLAQRLVTVLGAGELRCELSEWGRVQARRSDVNARLQDFLDVYSPEQRGISRAAPEAETSARACAARS
jgi:phosphatidylinositol alpha-mannosyltransferase